MVFRNLWILVFVPLLVTVFYLLRKRYSPPGFLFPTGELIKSFKGGLKVWLVRKAIYLRLLALILIIVALARPQMTKEREIRKEGIAIMLAIDTSSTMLADDVKLGLEDFARQKKADKKKELRRIDAVREVAKDFVKGRKDDFVGVVAFASEAFTVCPLTFDHEWVLQALERVDVGLIEDGTAIGSGILSSLNSLKDIDAKSKIIVLLTDGINNFGRTPPMIAAKAARALGIKIYAIGLVGRGSGLELAGDGSGRKVYRGSEIHIDEAQLKEIANLTGGEYFRADEMDSLRDSYKQIDELEKGAIEEAGTGTYMDVFQYFLFPALLILLIDIVLRNTLLRTIP